jgi:hypothetical protein
MTPQKPRADTRPAQAARVADFLEQCPKSTAKEIDAVCDTGCITKVMSAMEMDLRYVLTKGWRTERCASGHYTRRVRTYSLLFRPSAQPDLFTPE